jgi:hypothetical protein
MHLIFAPVFLQIIVVMVVLSISIEGGIAIVENHSVYASSSPASSTATLSSNFNLQLLEIGLVLLIQQILYIT